MAIVTSVTAAPLLRWTMAHVAQDDEELRRAERPGEPSLKGWL